VSPRRIGCGPQRHQRKGTLANFAEDSTANTVTENSEVMAAFVPDQAKSSQQRVPGVEEH
jgi:hypothetical protein